METLGGQDGPTGADSEGWCEDLHMRLRDAYPLAEINVYSRLGDRPSTLDVFTDDNTDVEGREKVKSYIGRCP